MSGWGVQATLLAESLWGILWRAISQGVKNCLIQWRLMGELCLETWMHRDESSGSKLFIDSVVGYVRLGKETELFVYQEKGSPR